MSDDFEYDKEFLPYDVTCARCGKVISCEDANLEEGDEWECWPCADRCNAQEAAERSQSDAAMKP